MTSCIWRIEVAAPADGPVVGVDDLRDGIRGLLAAPHLPVTRERKGKPVSDDIRPNVVELQLIEDGVIEVELATQPRGVRPSELLAALSPFVAGAQLLEEGRVCRTHQWIVLDGARREPLPPGATWAPHAQARAS